MILSDHAELEAVAGDFPFTAFSIQVTPYQLLFLLYLVPRMQEQYRWVAGDEPVTEAEFDVIQERLSDLFDRLMQGQVIP